MRYRLRTLLIVLAVACHVSPALGSEPGNELAKKEMEKLQGEWTLVYCRYNGKDSFSAESTTETTITFNGNHFVVKEGQKVSEEGTVELDPNKSPATFDYVVTVKDGRDVHQKQPGIYILKVDLLVLCISYDDFRPVVVSAELNSRRALIIYRRK